MKYLKKKEKQNKKIKNKIKIFSKKKKMKYYQK